MLGSVKDESLLEGGEGDAIAWVEDVAVVPVGSGL
jgi:hypothetical protein